MKILLCCKIEQTKTMINPMKRMGAIAPDGIVLRCANKSKLLTPKAEQYHHPLTVGNILFKAINLKNLSFTGDNPNTTNA